MDKKERAALLHLLSQQFAPASTQGSHESHPRHSEGWVRWPISQSCPHHTLWHAPPKASSPSSPLKYQKPGTQRQTILKPWHCSFQKDSLWYFPGMVNHSIENCERFLHERHNTPEHSYLHSLNMTITHKTACLANSFLPHILAFSFTGWTYL